MDLAVGWLETHPDHAIRGHPNVMLSEVVTAAFRWRMWDLSA